LGEGWWTPVTIQAGRRSDGRLGLDVVDESDRTGSCAGLPSVPDPEPTAPLDPGLGTNRDLIISSE
jgi:hypothetical protein